MQRMALGFARLWPIRVRSRVKLLFAIAFIGFVVWGHHLYTTGIIPSVVLNFTLLTYVIAIPSGIKTFNWISTLHAARIKLEAPMLFAIAFIVGFVFGGFTGIIVNVVPIDIVFQDTYFVVAHFHYIVIGGTVSIMFGSIYYILPHMTGKMYNKNVALWHFVTWVVGFIMTFGSIMILGMLGMPRRYFDWSNLQNADIMSIFHFIATIGAFTMGISFLLFFYNVIWTLRNGPKVDRDDPFGLEDGLGLNPPMASHH